MPGQDDVDLLVRRFQVNGYAVFGNFLPPEKVDRLRAAYLDLLAWRQELARNATATDVIHVNRIGR